MDSKLWKLGFLPGYLGLKLDSETCWALGSLSDYLNYWVGKAEAVEREIPCERVSPFVADLFEFEESSEQKPPYFVHHVQKKRADRSGFLTH